MPRIKPVYDEDLHDQGSSRRPRGWLNTDVKRITDHFVTGRLVITDESKNLTPYRIVQAFKDIEMIENPPSVGAVTEVLRRWERWEFAEIGKDPLRFVDYTDKGRNLGIAECERLYKEKKNPQPITSTS